MNSQVRHVSPVPVEGAEGLVGAVYGQVRSELGVVGPAITMLSPAPELLAPVWALLRESLLVGGPVERLGKEVVATTPQGPFPAEAAPRYLGTALVFELITRLVRSLTVNASPHPVTATRLGRAVASRRLRDAVAADLEPGLALPLLGRLPDWAAPAAVREPAWAAGSPVGAAYGAVRAMAAYGSMLISDDAADAVHRAVAAFGPDVGDRLPPLDEIEAMPEQSALGARLAVSAALAPGRVADADVVRWRGEQFTDHCVVYLLAYGAMAAVDTVQDEFNETRDVDA